MHTFKNTQNKKHKRSQVPPPPSRITCPAFCCVARGRFGSPERMGWRWEKREKIDGTRMKSYDNLWKCKPMENLWKTYGTTKFFL